jgi:hypothetical protein
VQAEAASVVSVVINIPTLDFNSITNIVLDFTIAIYNALQYLSFSITAD